MFPITPTDLRDRDLSLRHTVCGFQFAAEKKDTRPLLVRPEVKEQTPNLHYATLKPKALAELV
jgi:hypothetical protein